MKRWIPTTNENGRPARVLITDEPQDPETRLKDQQEDDDARVLNAYVKQQMEKGARTLGDLGRELSTEL